MPTLSIANTNFHEYDYGSQQRAVQFTYQGISPFIYNFENFFHPFVGDLIRALNEKSLSGMLDPAFHGDLKTDFFEDFYTLLENEFVRVNHFPKEIDLREGGPYANYNWELLFHIPLTIAVHLSKNQRFAEARRWFHYIFDPSCNDTSIPTPKRFWKFLAFRADVEITQIDELLALLSKSNPDEDEKKIRDSILSGYEAIKNKPFQPHAVARTRQLAYQYSVVMKYLDNLIAWGDSLFRQDTIESINEATQRYVLAANLLGPRPLRIPRSGASRPKTFKELKEIGFDPMGNALVALEGKFPLNLGMPLTGEMDPDAAGPLFGIGRTLFFCIPRNEKMLGYWDTVADRLFKIRNCMNIEGVVRQLALFEPPLDPGMMVKAVAAGIDIGSIIGGLNQPIGPVRSLLLIQKAMELCGEVRGLGGALLSAIEKGDSERMALLRQGHEIKIQEISREVRFLQWKQAEESTESLLTGRASALERYRYYQRLLGLTPDDESAPDTFPIDRRKLTEENFDEAYAALVGQYEKPVPVQALSKLTLAEESSPATQSGASGSGQLYLNANENADLNIHGPTAQTNQELAWGLKVAAPALGLIPQFPIHLHYWGLGASIEFGGEQLSKAALIGAEILELLARRESYKGSQASKTAGFERRADDWMQQSNLAARELMQIGRQLIGSLIAEQIAHHEYLNIQKQIEHSQEVDQFLREKFNNEELYAWMQGEISRLYYEYYRFAFDTARKAEQSMKRELMRPEVDATDYVKFNYWDGGRKGLLSGEALYLDVKRMEMAYHENNKREYELTKSVSLRQLDPVALLALKATGACEVALPEWLFDLDGPGHYMRRIKNVSLSIPSVTGPNTSVNCTLTLSKSSLRTSSILADGEYAREGSEDGRFIDYFGAVQSIVTSSGNNDSGMFETNLRDERILPFEGAGAESSWKLELPAAFRQFDYDTISDVILHVRYTARQGGAQMRDKAVENLESLVEDANATGLALLFSLKHDFPAEWHQFVTGDANFATTIKRDFFPYFLQGKDIAINAIELHAIQNETTVSAAPGGVDLATLTQTLNDDGAFDISFPPDGAILAREPKSNVFVLIKYSIG